MAMHTLLSGDFDHEERAHWQRLLGLACPAMQWLDDPQARACPELVRAAVVARPAAGSLQGYPNLALIQSLWAGVDSLLADPTLPAGVPLARMVDPMMNQAMAETALWAVLSLQRHGFDYLAQQRQALWLQHRQRRADELGVSVLGLGEMGLTVARRLAANGYRVTGWARSARPMPEGVGAVFGQEALGPLLRGSQILINLLPLTLATRELLAAPLFDKLPQGAAIVNLGRGAHLVEADLLAALASGRIGHAVLDVFASEPLPPAHAFWSHPNITVLPHVAAATDARSACAVVAANLAALAAGRSLAHLVDRTLGY